MPAASRLAMVRQSSRWRRLFADRRRGAAVLLVADTVLLSAAAVVWLPLLAPDRAATPIAPAPSVIVSPSPSPTIIWPVERPPFDTSGMTSDIPPSRPARPLGRPATVSPDAPPTTEPAPLPPPTVVPPVTATPSGPPAEHEVPPVPEPSPGQLSNGNR